MRAQEFLSEGSKEIRAINDLAQRVTEQILKIYPSRMDPEFEKFRRKFTAPFHLDNLNLPVYDDPVITALIQRVLMRASPSNDLGMISPVRVDDREYLAMNINPELILRASSDSRYKFLLTSTIAHELQHGYDIINQTEQIAIGARSIPHRIRATIAAWEKENGQKMPKWIKDTIPFWTELEQKMFISEPSRMSIYLQNPLEIDARFTEAAHEMSFLIAQQQANQKAINNQTLRSIIVESLSDHKLGPDQVGDKIYRRLLSRSYTFITTTDGIATQPESRWITAMKKYVLSPLMRLNII